MATLLVSSTLFLPFPADRGHGDARSTLEHRTVIQTALSGFVVLSAVVVPRSLVVVMIVEVVVAFAFAFAFAFALCDIPLPLHIYTSSLRVK